jgi:hypothetical protein
MVGADMVRAGGARADMVGDRHDCLVKKPHRCIFKDFSFFKVSAERFSASWRNPAPHATRSSERDDGDIHVFIYTEKAILHRKISGWPDTYRNINIHLK